MKNIIEIIKNYWWLIFVGLWVLYSVFFSADRDQTGNVTKSGWVDSFELQAGDCILDNDLVESLEAGDETFYQYWVTPCEQEHSLEIFYQYDLGNDYTDFPGADTISTKIDEICFPAFENYVGHSFDEIIENYATQAENLDITAYIPLEESWFSLKTIDCFVYPINNELMRGSVKDLLR